MDAKAFYEQNKGRTVTTPLGAVVGIICGYFKHGSRVLLAIRSGANGCNILPDHINIDSSINHPLGYLGIDISDIVFITTVDEGSDKIPPTSSSKSALETQEGGDHYKNLAIQPVEFILANKIPFIEGNVIKYVVRHRNKNGAQDIRKAIHFLNMLLEMEYPEETK